MTSRAHRLVACAAVAAMTSTALAVGVATHASAAPFASPWLKVSAGAGIDVSSQPRVVRWQGKLIVVWTQESADNLHETLNSRLLTSTGKLAAAISTALTWSSLTADPAVFLLHGTPTIAFGGLRSTDTSDLYNGAMAYVQAPDASSWALGAGSLTQSRSAYGDYGFGAVDDGTGQPITAGAYSSSDHLTIHHGIDPAVPASAPDTYTAGTGTDAQNANLAIDSKTGVAWALWYSADSSLAQQGIRAAEVYPTLSAPLAPAPLSTVQYAGAAESINDLQDVGVASRVGGGVWAVYGSGYPEVHKLVLWHVGTATKLTLNTAGEAQYPTVTAAPDGRLWVLWIEGSTVHAVRTNPSVTAWGVPRTLNSPAAPGEAPTHTAGDGALGPLDAVINVVGKDPTPEIFSTRILEALKVGVSPAAVSYTHGGKATVTVTDAGVPVAGVTVRVAGKLKVTNAHGKVVFAFPAKVHKGRYAVTAAHAGWWPGSASLTVR